MKIKLNEQTIDIASGTGLWALKAAHHEWADICIYNGAVCEQDILLQEGDHVHLITRGEVPSAEDLEALMVARHTPGVHAKIKGSMVGIAGLGGLGSAIAVALARIGVGRLILADFDVVEPSNLNRQQYFVDQIGLPKTEALTANLQRINPYVEVEAYNEKLTPDTILQRYGHVDVMVEAFDRPDQKAMLLQTVTQELPDTPLVAASGMAGYGPGEAIGIRKMGARVFVVGDLETAAAPGCGLMAPRVGICAHMQANLVLRILLGEELF